jgi:hypothetical protein
VKHDDQTVLATGGNKVRKREFLFADALAQKCEHVVTLGEGRKGSNPSFCSFLSRTITFSDGVPQLVALDSECRFTRSASGRNE